MRLIAINKMHSVESTENDRTQRRDVNLCEVHIDLLRTMYPGYRFPIHDRKTKSCC